jgi:hypothetical protein
MRPTGAKTSASDGLEHFAGKCARHRRDANDRCGLQRADRRQKVTNRRERVRVGELVLGKLTTIPHN